jgi:hypothetical protein
MSINRYLYSIIAACALASCAEQYVESYNIQGSSSVTIPDGIKLYLRTKIGNELKDIDSCDVVHGDFAFSGKLDTTRLAILSIDKPGVPPVLVIERGDITVNVSETGLKVTGSPLNDKLYEYIGKQIQLENQQMELERKQTRLILEEGIDEEASARKVAAEVQMLLNRADSLETYFILENQDNVIGPFAFQMLTLPLWQKYNYPVFTPQIEEIMAKASQKFKTDPYVSEYYTKGKEFLARMRGEMSDDSEQKPVSAAAGTSSDKLKQ